MTDRLLTLTFHAPNVLLKEDALFKKYGTSGPLLASESLGDVIPDSLKKSSKLGPASGLSGAYADSNQETFQISLNEVGFNAWWRDQYKRREGSESEFEAWMKPKISKPCTVMLIAGHHGAYDNGQPVVWGAADAREHSFYRYFTALLPGQSGGKPVLTVKGHPYRPGTGAVVRAGPFDFSTTLSSCRLLMIMACNGVDYPKYQPGKALGLFWQKWVALATGRRPVVLGWYGTHSMPRDAQGESFSKTFWSRLESLATAHATDLSGLCETHASKVILAWGEALKDAYATSATQRHLWYDPRRRVGRAMLERLEATLVRAPSGSRAPS